jgi:type I restriction enzyme S subunit
VFPGNVDKHTLEGELPVSLCNYTDVYYRDWITADIDFMSASATETEIERFSLRVGDTIFTKDSESADDIGGAALVVEEMPGVVCGYHLYIARPRERAFGGYIKRFFDSTYAKAMFETRANGLTRVGLGQHAVDNVPIPVPPLDEKRAIAAFLDRETGKIDPLVEEQRRLIALLKEKRQAVISHAVTKGLDPTAPLNPSGIDWLGDIPAHWEPGRLKHDLAFLTSGSRGRAAHSADNGALFIRIGNLLRETLDLYLEDIQRVNDPEGTEGERTRVQGGDLLFSITAYLGSVAVVPDDLETAYVSQHVALARLRQCRLRPRWAGCATLSFVGRTYLDEQGYGGTKIQLALDDVANLVILMPPLGEQERILRYIDSETAKLDALISEAETAIDLLQERRSALISAAVTGKLTDVREMM